MNLIRVKEFFILLLNYTILKDERESFFPLYIEKLYFIRFNCKFYRKENYRLAKKKALLLQFVYFCINKQYITQAVRRVFKGC